MLREREKTMESVDTNEAIPQITNDSNRIVSFDVNTANAASNAEKAVN